MIDTYLLIVCRLNYPHSIWNHVHSFWLLSPFWMMYEAKNCVIQMFRCTFCNLLLIFSISPLHNFVNCCNWMILLSTFFSEMLLKSVGTIHFICVGSECEIGCCLLFFVSAPLSFRHTQCNAMKNWWIYWWWKSSSNKWEKHEDDNDQMYTTHFLLVIFLKSNFDSLGKWFR